MGGGFGNVPTGGGETDAGGVAGRRKQKRRASERREGRSARGAGAMNEAVDEGDEEKGRGKQEVRAGRELAMLSGS